MMPAPVLQEVLLNLGTQLVPFGVGCAIFVLATLAAMLVAMLTEVHGETPLPVLRAPLRPVSGVQVDQAA